MMAAQLHSQGIGQALKEVMGEDGKDIANCGAKVEQLLEKTRLINKAGDSKSPFVRERSNNLVAWQLWGDDAITLAQKENKVIFLSIGFSACHCEYLDTTLEPVC